MISFLWESLQSSSLLQPLLVPLRSSSIGLLFFIYTHTLYTNTIHLCFNADEFGLMKGQNLFCVKCLFGQTIKRDFTLFLKYFYPQSLLDAVSHSRSASQAARQPREGRDMFSITLARSAMKTSFMVCSLVLVQPLLSGCTWDLLCWVASLRLQHRREQCVCFMCSHTAPFQHGVYTHLSHS